MLYVKDQKELCGMLKSTLLFYKKVRCDLEPIGFEINTYDPCVANMMINDQQMTIIWHVNNFKISHKYGWDFTKIIKLLGNIYGDKKGKSEKHHYLGMDLDFEIEGMEC